MQYKVVAVVSTLAFTVTAVAKSSGSFHNSDSNFVSKSFEQSSSIFCEDNKKCSHRTCDLADRKQ